MREAKPDPWRQPKQAPPAVEPRKPESWRQRVRRLVPYLRQFTLIGTGVAIALIAMTIFSVLNPPPPRITQRDINNAVAHALASATPPPPYAAQIYPQIQPSLVEITTRFTDQNGRSQNGQGTGIVLDDQGTILTSLHVVKDALETTVTFADGTDSGAMLMASETAKDIAVLRALNPPAELVPATLGNPNSLQVGDVAIAVGHPFGLTDTLTVGSISGLNRSFRPPNGKDPMVGLIQFDAAVNPGNSGGPLLDRDGNVVGIVTGLVNPTGQDVFIGIGFAVPIDVAASAAGTPPY